jgi:hypothetical protein
MKRYLLGLVLAGALVLSAPALAAGTLSGSYSTHIASGPAKGSWSLTFTSSGAYTLRQGSAVGVQGHAKFSAGKVTFSDTGGPLACQTAGVYSIKQSGSTLRFTRVKDTCQGRPAVLAGTFKKAG